jgi:CRP-like cAMP-binding protein
MKITNDLLIDTERKILASGILINYLPSEFLFRHGQKAEFVFYLKRGSFEMQWPEKDKKLLISQRNVFIGLDEAFIQGRYVCTAMTTELSEFLVFERAYFMELINEFEYAVPYLESMQEEFIRNLSPKEMSYFS